MFYYAPWIFLKHALALEGEDVRNVSLKLSDHGHDSMKKTQLEGTWEEIDEFGKKRYLCHLDAYDEPKPKRTEAFGLPKPQMTKKRKQTKKASGTSTKFQDKKNAVSGGSPRRKLRNLCSKKGKWVSGEISRLQQSQAYPDAFCRKVAMHTRKTLEAHGHTYGTLRAEMKKTEPSSPTVDQALEKLYLIENNAAKQQRVSVLTMLGRTGVGKSCWDDTTEASGGSGNPTAAPGTPSILEDLESQLPRSSEATVPEEHLDVAQNLDKALAAAEAVIRVNRKDKDGNTASYKDKLDLLIQSLETLPKVKEHTLIHKHIANMNAKYTTKTNGSWNLGRNS